MDNGDGEMFAVCERLSIRLSGRYTLQLSMRLYVATRPTKRS